MAKHLYFVGLVPGQEVRKQVRQLKLEMKEQFHASHALKAPAHITLQMPFRRGPEFEEVLSSQLEQFSSLQQGFTVHLHGFDCFAPRVIFLHIENHAPINNLHESLQRMFKEDLNFKPDELQHRFHPHMTIATRDLSKKHFRKAWEVFKERAFEANFELNGLCLLKHNGQNWDVYKTFPFAR